MKPAIAILSALLFAACVGQAPEGDDDMPPPRIKEPPTPKGGGTSPGCDGITSTGKCEDGVALTCDVANDRLLQKNCKALGKGCAIGNTEDNNGAHCTSEPPPGGGGCNGLDNKGVCSADGETATWCDPDGVTLVEWVCDKPFQGQNPTGDASWSCKIDPGFGAFCFAGSTGTNNNTADCPTLGYYGVCSTDNKQAIYCTGAGDGHGGTGPWVKHIDNCPTGSSCQLDVPENGVLIEGAACHSDAPPPPPPPPPSQNICLTAENPGWQGHCIEGGAKVEYCDSATPPQPHKIDCAAIGKTCGDVGGYVDCK
jgi:hypothetical protein